MKTKRFFAGLSAFAIAAAMFPVSAFADDITIDQNSTDKKGAMTATYNVQAKYTVTIPAGAPIGEDTDHPEETSITASGVVLEEGQKITVTLSQAANTAKGESAFTAKNGTSAVTYAIKKGSDLVKVGDPVAEFTANGEQALSFYKTGGTPTVAGAHTETLTFSIATESAITPVTAITLNKTSTSIKVGSTETLSVSSVTPDDATDQTVTWSSDKESVATVNAKTGEVTAVAKGTANITATANDGSGVTATCTVTVNSGTKSLTVGSITFEYNNGDTWQTMVDSKKYGLWIDQNDQMVYNSGANNLCHDSIGYANAVYASDPIDKYTNYLWW